MELYTYEPKEYALIAGSCLPLAVFQYIDNRLVPLALSAGFCSLFGFSSHAEARARMDSDMYLDAYPNDIAASSEAVLRFAQGKAPLDIVCRVKIRGTYRRIHVRGEVQPKEEVKLLVVWYADEGECLAAGEAAAGNAASGAVLSDCSPRPRLESSFYQQMHYDDLTGLPSMTYFFELAEDARKSMVKENKSAVMLFFDLTGMKYYNAKYGFAEGNALIRAFSRLLVKHFSSERCCRFGMDRFCVYTSDFELEDRLWKLFSDSESMNGGKTLPVRAGIYPDKLERVSASLACDRAKMACDTSRAAYVSHFTYFDESMLEAAEERQYIIDNIDRALVSGWIQVYYQPIIRAANGRVCDEEALSRWKDPKKGLLRPDDFIPILEDANLIYKLDLYVTDRILEKMKKQADEGLYVVPISVNLSRSDFDTCDIVSEIQKRVDAAGIAREKLTIEITESVIARDFDYMKAQIDRFLALGFKVWMDDFGSGYSSLDVLQEIRFNLMKIDMRFMQQFYANEKSKIILTELIKMAVGLDIETIVEGVETSEQVEFLKEVGCTKLQGFYYCKPIPLEQILERYESGRQIGFENPAESDYFASLGKVNLYDLSAVTTNDGGELFENYFNTLPMTILESNAGDFKIIRSNKSFRLFIHKYFAPLQKEKKLPLHKQLAAGGLPLYQAVQEANEDGKPTIFDDSLQDGTVFHMYLRRIAVNPVTGVTALVLVVLGVHDGWDRALASVSENHQPPIC